LLAGPGRPKSTCRTLRLRTPWHGNDVSTETYLKFAAYCNPDCRWRSHSTMRRTPALGGRIPRTFIRCTENHTILLALQDGMISEADAVTPH
jgi:hypothetical protein